MTDDQRTAWFRDRNDKLSADEQQAIIEMAPEVSGVPKSRHDLLVQAAWQEQHGPALEEIATLNSAIEAAESAVEASRDECRKECGIADVTAFNKLAAEYEAKHETPWLRRVKNADKPDEEIIRVVDLERQRERLATPAEIEAGEYFKDLDDYQHRTHKPRSA